jgi:hypothetical protein
MQMAHVTMKNNVLSAQCFLPKSTCGNLIETENIKNTKNSIFVTPYV